MTKLTIRLYAVAQTTVFDLDCFATPNDLLINILITEGKEIINEAPFNEEDVVDNKITLPLYDASRCPIFVAWPLTRRVEDLPWINGGDFLVWEWGYCFSAFRKSIWKMRSSLV